MHEEISFLNYQFCECYAESWDGDDDKDGAKAR